MEMEDLEEKRAKLKSWLALHRMSRKEFADKIGMHVTSVNGWFSNVNIPDSKWLKIKKLFEEQPKEIPPLRQRVLGSVFSEEEMARILKAAGSKSLEEYLRISFLKQVDQDLSDQQ